MDAAFLVQLFLFQGLSLACLVGLLLFAVLSFLVQLLLCLLCVAAIFCCCAVGFCSEPVTEAPGLLFFVKFFDFLSKSC